MTRKPDTDIVIEDLELFRQTVGPIEPVFHDRIEPDKCSATPFPRSTRADERQVLQDMLSDYFTPDELDTGEELYHCSPGLQHAVLRKLRRGQFRVGAVLDLHGMNVTAARQALVAFIHSSRREQMTCIRIIHGKGKRSRNNKGPVIKPKVNQWLRQRDEVLAFCSARPVDGGTGAVYVLLRRNG